MSESSPEFESLSGRGRLYAAVFVMVGTTSSVAFSVVGSRSSGLTETTITSASGVTDTPGKKVATDDISVSGVTDIPGVPSGVVEGSKSIRSRPRRGAPGKNSGFTTHSIDSGRPASIVPSASHGVS